MVESEDSKRVGYVFSGETVEYLRQLGQSQKPIFKDRSATWLVEFAIHELYFRVVVDDEPAASE